MYLDIIRKQKV